MSKKLQSKQDVIEWYWIDYLNYCMVHNETEHEFKGIDFLKPTVDGFWSWYISDKGPLGVKKALRFYSKTEVEYV